MNPLLITTDIFIMLVLTFLFGFLIGSIIMKKVAIRKLTENNENSNGKTEELKNKILKEYKKGNIVVSTSEGIMTTSLKDIINQPTEGLLYDLNRDEATILTLIDDPKWINDYACMVVIRELKKQLKHQEDK